MNIQLTIAIYICYRIMIDTLHDTVLLENTIWPKRINASHSSVYPVFDVSYRH